MTRRAWPVKQLLLILVSWCLLFGSAWGQQSGETEPVPPSLEQITPTPTESMWLYLQQTRRYDDPRQAVRRKAEERAQQRRDRIAVAKSLGLSKQRPWVMPSPFTSFYSPQFYSSPYVIIVPPWSTNPRASARPDSRMNRR